VISKLILRAVNHYARLYNRRVIATAKSEGGLDEEFKVQVVIALKNPTREQREESLRKLHAVIDPDDSPVHITKHQLSGTRRIAPETVASLA
jgi:hypothetical protein